jgi:hypothetical protein
MGGIGGEGVDALLDDQFDLGTHTARCFGQSMAKCSGEQYHWFSHLNACSVCTRVPQVDRLTVSTRRHRDFHTSTSDGLRQ